MRLASSVAAEMGQQTSDVLSETSHYVSPLPITLAHWRDPARHSNPFLLANIRRGGVAAQTIMHRELGSGATPSSSNAQG